MANPVEALLILIGACFSAGAIGASFVFGIALVCRWMGWAPVNTAVHVHYHEASDDVGGSPKP